MSLYNRLFIDPKERGKKLLFVVLKRGVVFFFSTFLSPNNLRILTTYSKCFSYQNHCMVHGKPSMITLFYVGFTIIPTQCITYNIYIQTNCSRLTQRRHVYLHHTTSSSWWFHTSCPHNISKKNKKKPFSTGAYILT